MSSLTTPATMDSFEKLMAFVRSEAGAAGYAKAQADKIALAFEEAVVNVIHYAYAGGNGTVTVTVSRAADQGLVVEIDDSGIAFNPLEHDAPDVHAPAEERPIGGLGIHMIRTLMDVVGYRRENGHNILHLEKRPPEK